MSVDLFLGELLARGGFAGGVADEGGGVSDEEDDGVTELLEVAQLADEHCVAQVQVGRGGVEAGFDAERRTRLARGFETRPEVFKRDDLGGALGEEGKLFFNWWERLHALSSIRMGMPDRVPKRDTETPKKQKICKTCGRTFEWRKKWEKDWDVVKYCSDRCRGQKPGAEDTALEAGILQLLAERGRDKTICPSEAAKLVGGKEERRDWEGLMEPARAAARRLVAAGEIVITQGGRVVDAATARGAIRLKLK